MTQHEHNEDKAKTYTIMVNAREKVVEQHKLSYEEVVTLAGFPLDNPDYIYTITYEVDEHKDKSLTSGDSVVVKDGMIFDVIRTIKS
jgi:hypothetical protein